MELSPPGVLLMGNCPAGNFTVFLRMYVGNVRSSTFPTHQHLNARGPHATSFSSWAFQHPCRSQANPSRSELVAFILSEVVGVIRVFQIQQTALCESLKDNNQICTWISELNDSAMCM